MGPLLALSLGIYVHWFQCFRAGPARATLLPGA